MIFSQYVLSKIAEEAIELAKEILKGQQHGLFSGHRGHRNINYVRDEFIDMMARAEVLSKCSDIQNKCGDAFELFPAYIGVTERNMLDSDISIAKMCHYALLDYKEHRLTLTTSELEYVSIQADIYKEYLKINSQ